MTLFGCVLVTGVLENGGNISVTGILAGLGAGLGYALYSIFGRYALEKGYHSLTITFYTFLTASIASLFTGDIGHVASVAVESSSMLLFSFAFGILCTVIPYLVYTIGLNYIENSRASILASIEPVTATILGILVFQEPVSLPEVVGMALVVGAFIVCRKEN
jgi:drug/metabolite transporter (DMT)-like permease